jgi:hypothetical protein
VGGLSAGGELVHFVRLHGMWLWRVCVCVCVCGLADGCSAVFFGGIVLVFAVQVWTPVDNIKFETLSYLPPLTPDQIATQIDYMLANKWIPCLEFDLVS